MQHRDEIVIKKVISEIEIGLEMLGDTSLDVFLTDEKLKRALGMTVINIGELVKVQGRFCYVHLLIRMLLMLYRGRFCISKCISKGIYRKSVTVP